MNPRFFALSLAAAAVASGVARADLALVQTVRLSVGGNPSPAQTMRIWNRGAKTRYDVGPSVSAVIDLDAKTITAIDRVKKTFRVSPYALAAPPSAPSGLVATPTARHANLAGHPARLTRLSATMSGMRIEMELWTADDIPRVALPTLSGVGDFDFSGRSGFPTGHPLRLRLVTAPGSDPRSVAILTSEAAGISVAPIDDAVFAVPAGFVAEPERPLPPPPKP